jgi:hypothetical protein
VALAGRVQCDQHAAVDHEVAGGMAWRKQIADEMEDWYRSKACTGFVVMAPVPRFHSR